MNSDMHLGRIDLPSNYFRYQVQGLMAYAPSTGSTQAAVGGSNITALRVNELAGFVVLPGANGMGAPAIAERAATADVELVNQAAFLTTGQDRYVTRVAYRRSDTGAVDYRNVFGAAATHGSAVKPTPAEIQAAVGAGNPWVSLYSVMVYRSADTTIVATRVNTERPLGVPRSDGVLRTSAL